VNPGDWRMGPSVEFLARTVDHSDDGGGLARRRWLAAVLDPAAAVRFETYGYGPLGPGWGYADRRVPEQLVYSVVDNELAAEIAGRCLTLPLGGFVLLPPGTRHTFAHADEAAPVSLQWFRLALTRHGRPVTLGGAPVVLRGGGALREHLERLHDDRASGGADATLRIKASLALLFSSAFHLADTTPTDGPTLSYAQRQRLYELTRDPSGKRMSPAQIAAHMDLSADHFTRLFRRTFGVPPRRWLIEQRIRDAATLLVDSTMNVSQVADALGYPDVYQFSRQFKRVMGVSPRGYRERSG